MPYEATDTAAWWHGAEPLPPKPEGPGPWALTGTAYGWEWRRAEEMQPASGLKARAAVPGPFPPAAGVDDAVPLCVRREPSPWRERLARAELEAAPSSDVRVGDRVRHSDGLEYRVLAVPWHGMGVAGAVAVGRQMGMHMDHGGVFLSDIGPLGSGKPWTLLPRDPPPHAVTTLPAAMGHIPGPPTDADLAAMRAEAQARIEARRTGENDGAKFAVAPVPPGPADPCAQAAVRTLGRLGYVWLGGTEWKPPLGPKPDPRRDAERRVVEAARVFRARRNGSGMFEAGCRLDDALDALAALDGEGGR